MAPIRKADSALISAERLYKQGGKITASYTFIGSIITFLLIGLITQQPISAFMGSIVGGTIGYLFGIHRAFLLRTQAHAVIGEALAEHTAKPKASKHNNQFNRDTPLRGASH